GPMRVESINGRKYVLVIVDDYSRCTWTHFLRSKDETPAVLIDFFRLVQRGLHAQAKAIATTCFTQNRSLVIPRHEKTPYHIINDQKPSVKFFNIFGSVCYIFRDGENLDKMKEKGDECIFLGYSTQSKAYRVFYKRTRVIMESIHVNFDELPQMASDQISSDLAPECQTTALNHDSLSLAIQRQGKVTQADRTVTTSNELDLLFKMDAKMCMFVLTVSRTKPKNIKEALADSAWIESMQEELHQFDQLDVWELVDRPLC
nr:hypothetical protein [Tanacetum cinerariifolium]